MPFGAVVAVYAWDRLGGAITFLLQQVLLLPTARYVDDLFWVDFSCCAPDTSRMALELVSLLGFTLEPGKTPPPASCLDVLGVSVSLWRHSSDGHYEARLLPEPLKVAVWCQQISDALVSDALVSDLFMRLSSSRAVWNSHAIPSGGPRPALACVASTSWCRRAAAASLPGSERTSDGGSAICASSHPPPSH